MSVQSENLKYKTKYSAIAIPVDMHLHENIGQQRKKKSINSMYVKTQKSKKKKIVHKVIIGTKKV